MGLDQTWLVADKDADVADELHYHRKVPALEAFMSTKWRAIKGNEDGQFNCEYLEIDHQILDELEEAVVQGNLDSEASGFFWGSHRPEDISDILAAVEKARRELGLGREVVYTSWW